MYLWSEKLVFQAGCRDPKDTQPPCSVCLLLSVGLGREGSQSRQQRCRWVRRWGGGGRRLPPWTRVASLYNKGRGLLLQQGKVRGEGLMWGRWSWWCVVAGKLTSKPWWHFLPPPPPPLPPCPVPCSPYSCQRKCLIPCGSQQGQPSAAIERTGPWGQRGNRYRPHFGQSCTRGSFAEIWIALECRSSRHKWCLLHAPHLAWSHGNRRSPSNRCLSRSSCIKASSLNMRAHRQERIKSGNNLPEREMKVTSKAAPVLTKSSFSRGGEKLLQKTFITLVGSGQSES